MFYGVFGICLNCLNLCSGFIGAVRSPLVVVLKFHVYCSQNHDWGPLGARAMSIFGKTYILAEKAMKGHIEWCSQSTKSLDFGSPYEDITKIRYYIC